MTPGKWGWLAFLGFSVAWMGAAVLWSLSSSSPSRLSGLEPADADAPATASPKQVRAVASASAARAPDPGRARAELLARNLAELLGRARDAEESDEVSRIESELLALGELATPPIVARLMTERDTARRDLLLNFMRKLPGGAAEAFLIREARSGTAGSSRSIAMDALAERGSDESLGALDAIATTDPELPSQPLFSNVRAGEDTSTELPDEVDYTPRMKAMAALASIDDERVIPMLLRILQREREESLRMRAAEHLTRWQNEPSVREALRAAAARDASRYVRLAALHALAGSEDPALAALLGDIAARDPDAGVRLLAQKLLDR